VIGSSAYVRFRVYHDSYQNTLDAYTDASYTVLQTTGGMAPTGKSLYDDFTNGAILEGGLSFGAHSVKAVVQTRTDVHREGNGVDAWRHYQDSYLSAGAEGTFALPKSLELSAGLGLDRLKPEEQAPRADIQLPDVKNCFHGQVGLFWKPSATFQLYGTLAQKDRFPTLKDRYSTKFGSFLDNPELRPERSTNYEVGAKAQLTDTISTEGAIFRSDIRDMIQGIPVPGNLTQMQNIGKVRHTGVELSLAFKPSTVFQAGLGYTYLDRENLSSPAVKLTGTPRNHVTGYVRVQPTESLYFLASVETQSYLWDGFSTRTATISEKVGGFTTAQLSAGWEVGHGLSLDGGFRNLMDRNYQLSIGFPMPGRTWFANLRYNF
jgi:iron complex outermembrane receptor protein